MTATANQHVCVIGAGIAGLATAKVLSEDGFDVSVFEKYSDLGGTWATSRTYPGLRTNNSKHNFAFSDFQYPESADVYPYAEEVRDYLEAYADRFNIRSRIHFNKEVDRVSRLSTDALRFAVTIRSTHDSSSQEILEFDFVVVCNGVLHTPNVPLIDGMADFGGTVLHSSEVTDATYEGPGSLIIVGGGKSALDCAASAAHQGLSPTLIVRKAHWMAPRFMPGGIPGDNLMVSRYLALFMRYHHLRGIERFLHHTGKPLVDLWWRIVSFIFPRDLKMPPELTPTQRLPDGLEHAGVGGELYDAVNAGKATAKLASIKRFQKDRVELDNHETLPADTVIFATGWWQEVSFLDERLRDKIVKDGRFRLFRHILPPNVQNIGFIGYASSFASQLTAEIGAHWLSQHFLGGLELPSEDQMEAEIDRVHAWVDEIIPARSTGCFVVAHISHYVDDLIDDLGLQNERTGNFIKEYMSPFRASRYANLGKERRILREKSEPVPRHYYFSSRHAAVVVGLLLLFWIFEAAT